MKLYKIKHGIAIENENGFYLLDNEDCDRFINDDALLQKQPNKVNIKPFNGVRLQANKLSIDLPAKNVVVVRLQ